MTRPNNISWIKPLHLRSIIQKESLRTRKWVYCRFRFIFPVSWMEQNHGAINICITMFLVAGRVCWYCRMSWTFPKVSSLTGWFGPCPWIASSIAIPDHPCRSRRGKKWSYRWLAGKETHGEFHLIPFYFPLWPLACYGSIGWKLERMFQRTDKVGTMLLSMFVHRLENFQKLGQVSATYFLSILSTYILDHLVTYYNILATQRRG